MAAPFKAYDIRGIYPDQIDEQLAYRIGNACAQRLDLKGKRFTLGRDMRRSGPQLKEAFSAGLVDAGVRVIDVGMLSTPAVTFAMHHLDTAGGAQITASHNPAEYGGIKITGPGFVPVGGDSGLAEIEKIARDGEMVACVGGKVEEALVLEDYAAFLAGAQDVQRPLRIVVDGGNGIIGTMFQHLAPRLTNVEIIGQYLDPDGRFPHHDANPLKTENLPDLQARVRSESADYGAAFDGDGDRCALIDGDGAIVGCDMVTALLAIYYLEREGPGPIAYDLRSSKAVSEIIREHGGEPIETRVGHSFIKATLRETGAAFAGELSGHYYFRDFFGADSGLYAFILLANLISTSRDLAGMVAAVDRYHGSGEINFEVDDQEAVFDRIRSLADQGAEIAELDGVTARFADWWCNVRASNTEPVVRLNLEADTPDLLEEKLAEIEKVIKADGALRGRRG